ncbi:SDR family NAD(P)-dependent oxidoreductase [Subtercola frigoramans]|uniref:Gluconate 5-dehydrogenase n=1 Tax=Subtercola frigoramans TaxID=120298 RepID=A0ABS2L0Q2_9MICO|nr:SDR family oxidoreductase [Subtercola frigoramans]MBM7470657.1 gluconate 5-dehydrogenase [Subtercola frigoramans]
MPLSDELTLESPTGSDWLGLCGARVLVVGSGGIGSECAKGYAAAGATVMIVDRDADSLAKLAAQPEFERPPITRTADLTQPGAGAEVVSEAIAAMGGLDILLHCVGINDRRPVLEFSEDEWENVMKVNLFTAFAVTQAAGRHMVAERAGRIVVLSSVSGLLAHKNHAPYAASKGGLNQMMRVMASEWASSGVSVNAIAPGYVETALTSNYLARPGVRDGLENLVPAGRLGSPGDIVGPALFLSSKRASFITGHVLYIDGGRTLI